MNRNFIVIVDKKFVLSNNKKNCLCHLTSQMFQWAPVSFYK